MGKCITGFLNVPSAIKLLSRFKIAVNAVDKGFKKLSCSMTALLNHLFLSLSPKFGNNGSELILALSNAQIKEVPLKAPFGVHIEAIK